MIDIVSEGKIYIELDMETSEVWIGILDSDIRQPVDDIIFDEKCTPCSLRKYLSRRIDTTGYINLLNELRNYE